MTYKAEDFIKEIPGSGGVISTIATRVGCAWGTASKYICEHPTVMRAYEDECQQVCDLAVSVVIENMKVAKRMQEKGELAPTNDAKWWLSKKRKKEFGDEFKLDISGLKDEQLERLVRGDNVIDILANSG